MNLFFFFFLYNSLYFKTIHQTFSILIALPNVFLKNEFIQNLIFRIFNDTLKYNHLNTKIFLYY